MGKAKHQSAASELRVRVAAGQVPAEVEQQIAARLRQPLKVDVLRLLVRDVAGKRFVFGQRVIRDDVLAEAEMAPNVGVPDGEMTENGKHQGEEANGHNVRARQVEASERRVQIGPVKAGTQRKVFRAEG